MITTIRSDHIINYKHVMLASIVCIIIQYVTKSEKRGLDNNI